MQRLATKSSQYHQSVIDNAREAERLQPGRPLAIALDTVCLDILAYFTDFRTVTLIAANRKDPKSALAIPRAMRTFPSLRVPR